MYRETSRLVALVSRYVSSRELSVSLHPYYSVRDEPITDTLSACGKQLGWIEQSPAGTYRYAHSVGEIG